MLKKSKTSKRARNKLAFYEFVKEHANDYVELDSYLSKSKLYGVISEFNPHSLILTVIREHEKANNKNQTEALFIPMDSIKSIRKL